MSACEACWKEASGTALHSGRGTADVYEELIASRPTCPHVPATCEHGETARHMVSASDFAEPDAWPCPGPKDKS
jgi:hypothetical protein